MLKLKLKRTGTKRRPSYRVVVAEARSKRDGHPVEEIGFYNPRTDPPTIHLQMERVEHWLGCGARTTDTVRGLIARVRNRARIPATESMTMDESSLEETSVSDLPLPAEGLSDGSPAAPTGESAAKSEAPSSSPEEAPEPESSEPTAQEEKPAGPTE